MIQTKELRLGNYVKIKEFDFCKIRKIGLGDIELYLKDENYNADFIPVECELIYPIPLSPEILEKCGFKNNNLGIFELDGYDSQLDFYFDNDGNLIPHEYYTGQVVTAPIKYLHQLQNLVFFASGEELQVKL